MSAVDLNALADIWALCMLRACAQGALAAGLVWLLCRLFTRLPAHVRALLWWLVCVRTIVSFFVIGPLPLAILPAATQYDLAQTTSAPLPAPSVIPGPSSLSAREIAAPPAFIPATDRAAHSTPGVSPIGVVLCLWLGGVAFLLCSWWREWRVAGRVAAHAHPCGDFTEVSDVARAVGLAHAPPVLVSECAHNSVVIGPWRPAVVLCRADILRLTLSELRALLAHELAHIRRRDLWAGMVPNLARLLFFFDPFVWLACREYDLAREAACDAEALRVSGLSPADYGRLLLKISVAPARPVSNIAALGASSPYGLALRRRLHCLKGMGGNSRRLPGWVSALTVLMAIGALSLHPVRVGARTTRQASPTQPEGANRHTTPPKHVFSGTLSTATAAALGIDSILDADSMAPNSHTSTNQKEDQPMTTMPKLPTVSKPKLSRAVATIALAATTPALLSPAPAMAQQVSAAPIVSVPQTASPIPVPSPANAAPVPVFASAAPSTAAPIPAAVQAGRYPFTLRRGDSIMNFAPDRTIAAGQRTLAKAQAGDALVVDRDGKRYVITDPETLRRVQETFAPVDALSKQMEAKGKQMEDIGKPMEAVGKQMEAIGARMEAIGKQMEEQGKLLAESVQAGRPEAERQAIHEKMRQLQQQMQAPGNDMRGLSQQMREQAARMRPNGDEMRALSVQMRTQIQTAQEKITGIIDDAFAKNRAIEQKTP